MRFSPGPWSYSSQQGGKNHCFRAQVWDRNGISLAALDSRDDAEAVSRDAQLMAAGPFMLQALLDAMAVFEKEGLCDRFAYEKMRQAIAEATNSDADKASSEDSQ